MIYGLKGSSLAQRATVIAAETILAMVAAWLLFGGGIEDIGSWSGLHLTPGNAARRTWLLLFVLVTYTRMTFMLTVLLRRKIGWEEALSVPLAFGLYYVGFSLLGGVERAPQGVVDMLAIGLFVVGSTINSTSEVLRHRWKLDRSNRGKLYTGGLFRYSRHVNYFGDLLWVLGWALFTWNQWSLLIPALLFSMFAFYNVPLLDRHLAEKYGADFEAYRRRTKGLIPFLL